MRFLFPLQHSIFLVRYSIFDLLSFALLNPTYTTGFGFFLLRCTQGHGAPCPYKNFEILYVESR